MKYPSDVFWNVDVFACQHVLAICTATPWLFEGAESMRFGTWCFPCEVLGPWRNSTGARCPSHGPIGQTAPGQPTQVVGQKGIRPGVLFSSTPRNGPILSMKSLALLDPLW